MRLEVITDDEGNEIGQRRYHMDGTTTIRMMNDDGLYMAWGKEPKPEDIQIIRNAPAGASGTLTDRMEENQSNEPAPLDTLALKHHGLIDNAEAEMLMEGEETMPEAPPLDAYMHEPGAKDDETKPMSALVLGGFSGALQEVVKVGTFGAEKYSPNGWMHVPNAHDRYANAAMRHWLTSMNGNRFNHEDGSVRHLAQVIWNLMSVLEFELAEEQMHAAESEFDAPT